jgi:hypothetical protein
MLNRQKIINELEEACINEKKLIQSNEKDKEKEKENFLII